MPKLVLVMLVPLVIYFLITKIKSVKSSILKYRCIKPSDIQAIVIGCGSIHALILLFYRSHLVAIIVSILGFLSPRLLRDYKEKRRIREYKIQFREALYNLSTSVEIGISLENSIGDAVDKLILVFGSDAKIVEEFNNIRGKLSLNHSLESALLDFRDSYDIEDVYNFVELIITCRNKGGNLVELIKGCNLIISEKIAVEEDIHTMLTEKRFEQIILICVPIVLMMVLSTTSNEFMLPLFCTIQGRIAVSISLLLILSSYLISKRILDIEV